MSTTYSPTASGPNTKLPSSDVSLTRSPGVRETVAPAIGNSSSSTTVPTTNAASPSSSNPSIWARCPSGPAQPATTASSTTANGPTSAVRQPDTVDHRRRRPKGPTLARMGGPARFRQTLAPTPENRVPTEVAEV